MRQLYILLALLALAVSGYAQRQQKWKAPKRPKPLKWAPPKQKAPEVIDVWRPYYFSDNWFVDMQGGINFSLAENMAGHGLDICQPKIDLGIGKQFSNAWSTMLTIGLGKQKGWASKESLAASSLMESGNYNFQVISLYVEEEFSIVRQFLPYNEQCRFDTQMFFGAGMNYSFDFDDKVERWSRYGYPVDGTDYVNFALRGGLLFLYKASETADLVLKGSYHMVRDNYNGVKHSTSFAFDSYADVIVGVRLHLADHYGDHRYYKVRRWEATSLRTTEPKVADLLDDEKVKEYQAREATEHVVFGELMQTHISFYIDRTFVNDYQMDNIRIVADFLRRHPNVNLILRGYCGASSKSESPDMHLAERRVAAVKKALVKYYDVSPSRLEIWFDETATPPFPMKGEWIDGVVFQMVEK
jgi:hypothetical protein